MEEQHDATMNMGSYLDNHHDIVMTIKLEWKKTDILMRIMGEKTWDIMECNGDMMG